MNKLSILFLGIALIAISFCTSNTHSLTLNNETPHYSESQYEEVQTLDFKLYLTVLLITLPIISVALILIVPKKTNELIAEDLSKRKKKVNIGMSKRQRDDENL